jgi:electron transport complex protein RnfC
VVPLGKLPPDVGVLTMNIGSVAFVGRYMLSGMPLISRTVTVDGDAVPHPMNLRAPIGIHIRELCERCGVEDKPAKIILGGPMMGAATPDLNAALSKRDNAVLLFGAEKAKLKSETACIRCGCCVMACPMNLQPLKLEQAYFNRDAQALEALSAQGCMECGCCSYVCPAGRELVQRIRLGKIILRSAQAKEGQA